MTRLLAVPFADPDPDVLRSLIDDAGPVAFAFVIALGIALFFLGRSLIRQVKRVNPDLPPGPEDTQQAADRQLIRDAMDRGARDVAEAEPQVDGAASAPATPTADPGDPARS